jgi:3-oxoacyl-(acyl-carrier-protein) synthase III
MTLNIVRFGSYVPESYISAEKLSEVFGFNIEFIREKLGISKVFISNLTLVQMAGKSVEALNLSRLEVSNLDLIVVCTQTNREGIPHLSAMLQPNVSKSPIAAFDLSLGCSGFPYALSIVDGILQLMNYRSAIVVMVEKYSDIVDGADRNTKPLFSDAAVASLVVNEGKNPTNFNENKSQYWLRTVGYHLETFGELSSALRVLRNSSLDLKLVMEGRTIFNFVLDKVRSQVLTFLNENPGLNQNLKLIVPHQASKFVLEKFAESLGTLLSDKVVIDLGKYGNTTSSSIPLLLNDLMCEQALKSGDLILCVGFGVGLSSGIVCFEVV